MTGQIDPPLPTTLNYHVMRLSKAGIIFLLVFCATAKAQVSGTVESIGFDSYFRPDSWTPMVITITPETAKNDTYEIHVRLQDLDRDLPIFSRQITVTGATEGRNRIDRFRMYFMPPPTEDGLPDAGDAGSLQELKERLKVSLHRATGSKEWICDLPITGTVRNVDPPPKYGILRRGRKLIVAVSDNDSRPYYLQSSEHSIGVLEDVDMVTVRPDDLPESVLGYDSVDILVWVDADPAKLKAGGDEKFKAVEQFVRRGGRLVISQPFEWQKILAFEDLLPVTIQGVEQKDDLEPLMSLAQPPEAPLGLTNYSQIRDALRVLVGPFRFARAQAKPNTVVSEWITWKPDDYSPYIVRMPHGLGMITWIAQDLGDPSLVKKTRNGWYYAWNKVFDWNNKPMLVTRDTSERERGPWLEGTPMDVGKSLLERWMDLRSKSAWLITLAVLFFIGYWLIAGPGTYTYLATRRKTHLSWFIFGLCALIATGLTGLIVKLVLRGPPELKHFSVVRVAPGEPAVVTSRMGLYIPRDGLQKIEIKDTAAGEVSTITALAIHPTFLRDVPEQTGPEYTVPVSSEQAPAISVPYRSTLKKFQATWVGNIEGAVQGSARLVPNTFISGNITNGTGKELRNIYVAFNYPVKGITGGDWVLFIPKWNVGVTLDLAREFNRKDDGTALLQGWTDSTRPNGAIKVRGRINDLDWTPHWMENFSGSLMESTHDDTASPYRRSLAMLSFFDRMPPLPNKQPTGTRPGPSNRFELLRRGGRWMDMSQCISAGGLVVLAEAEGPIPIPLEVEGSKVTGDGLILYQFVLPIDRSGVASTTQPTSNNEVQ